MLRRRGRRVLFQAANGSPALQAFLHRTRHGNGSSSPRDIPLSPARHGHGEVGSCPRPLNKTLSPINAIVTTKTTCLPSHTATDITSHRCLRHWPSPATSHLAPRANRPAMAPTYSLTSHLCKTLQISWRQAHQDSRHCRASSFASSPPSLAAEGPHASPRSRAAANPPASSCSLPTKPTYSPPIDVAPATESP